MLTRLVGCALVLPFLHPIADTLQRYEPNPARLAADFHTAFNVLLALLFIGPLDFVAARLTRWLPDQPKAADPGTPIYLDSPAVGAPAVALVCAAREVLRMGDLIEAMLRQSMTALLTNDRKLVAEISRMDDAVDSLNEAVKLYVTRMTRDSMDDRDGYRAHGDRLLLDQPRTRRRHHRQESDGSCVQEDQARHHLLERGRG